MLNFLKRVLNTFVDQIVFIFISLFFLTSVLTFALDRPVLLKIFSCIAGLFYMSAFYCYFWNRAGRDWRAVKAALKKNPEAPVKFNMYHGFLAAIPLTVFNAALACLALVKGGAFTIAYRIANFGFIGFILNSENGLCIPWMIVFLFLPLIASGTGYIVGKSGFSITERYLPRMIYAKKKDNKN